MQADILRKRFLEFFKARKHKIVESDSLLPKDDQTVLFTPAGMNQFKRQFLGHISGFRRIATAQRCLRTDDLDKVGKTPSHLTFFEMLGNFSFGGYFKEDAITYAWEFLTEELRIAKERLWVSVYKDDLQAYKIWKDKIKVSENKIIKLGDKENFWPAQAKEHGPNGPCGPCSEIFFDQGVAMGCKEPDCNPSCDCGRFTEIWNLVFTQFNRKEGGVLEPLPSKNIDTGMGLERLAAVMQGVYTNFETDLFTPIVKEITANAGHNAKKEFIYAISDHLRAIVFAIYDGALPSNEGRGYVVRKLIRRSLMHLREIGIKKPFLYKLVPAVSEIMKTPYPELSLRRENIAQIILAEEKNFISTLESSKSLFEDKFKDLVKQPDAQKAGMVAFELYDTYGVPFELIKDWTGQNKIAISQDKFNQKLEEQKKRSKLESAMKGDVFGPEKLHSFGAKTVFFGYGKYEAKAKILKIVKDNTLVMKATKDDEASIILDKTLFYPESGGQVGDTGEFIKGNNIFQVKDTQKIDKVIVHKGRVSEGSFKAGNEVKIKVDIERRLSIARNHTATHLLQAALRKILGVHVQQQGSLVGFDKLRFDFTHFKDITKDELDRIEETVNGYIINNFPVKTAKTALSLAKKQGALAFFEEKYDQRVRMVSVGDFSRELCGGTHLGSTGQVGLFKIIQESSVASGTRRIEAVTGNFAYKMIKEQERLIFDVSSALNVQSERIIAELNKRLAYIKEVEKQLSSQKLDILQESIPELLKKAEIINNISVITGIENYKDMDLLRKAVDMVRLKTSNTVVALAAQDISKALLVIGITSDLLTKGLDARGLICDAAKLIGGSGGGRKDFAQAGGNKPENLGKAFQELKNIISNLK